MYIKRVSVYDSSHLGSFCISYECGTDFDVTHCFGGIMSLAQIGENSVRLVVDEQSFLVRELKIPKEIVANIKIDTHFLVQAWKTYCLSEKNLICEKSLFYKNHFAMKIKVNEQNYVIHYKIETISMGLLKDKRLVALAVVLLV